MSEDPPFPRRLGPYVIVEHLASGGMGAVYLALRSMRAAGIERLCVLKTVRKKHLENSAVVARFADEARTSLLLSHRNVCTTFDVEELDGLIVLAMEHIAGQSLRALFDTGERLTRDEVVAVAVEALEGLDHCHNALDPRTGVALGLVHRDLSPHNLMVSFAGDVKVIDFGVARSSLKTVATATGAIVGKLRYMAPEQLADDRVDRRADVFALAIVLVELLSGKRYWGDLKDEEIWSAGPAFRSPALDDVDGRLLPVLERALAYDASDRFGSAAAFRDGLIAAAGPPRAGALRRLMLRLFPRGEEQWLIDQRAIYASVAAFRDVPTVSPFEATRRVAQRDIRTEASDATSESAPLLQPTSVEASLDGTAPPSLDGTAPQTLEVPDLDLPTVEGPPTTPVSPVVPSPVEAGPRPRRALLAAAAFAGLAALAAFGIALLPSSKPGVEPAPSPVAVPSTSSPSSAAPSTPPADSAPSTLPTDSAPSTHAPTAPADSAPSTPPADSAPSTHAPTAPADSAPSTHAQAAPPTPAPTALAEAARSTPAPASSTTAPTASASPTPAPTSDPSADRPAHAQEKRVPLAPRPARLGERVRYLAAHCKKVACASAVDARGRALPTMTPDEIEKFSADVERCLDRCGAPR